MSSIQLRSVMLLAAMHVAAAGTWSCRGDAQAGGRNGERLSQAANRDVPGKTEAAAQDPCTLLSAGESEPYVGVLSTPPYRADDDSGAADATGEECMYRGRDGRQLTVLPQWGGGTAVGKVVQDIPDAIGRATKGTNAEGLGTIAGKVLKQGPAGPWDRTTWIPGGALFVYKDDAQIRIDMSGASGKQSDALALAREIVPRIGRPLAYDGARAVALAPKPKPHPASACAVLPRAEVETAIGQLQGEPMASSDGNTCTYRVSSPQGERSYEVSYGWQQGQKNYTTLVHGTATVTDMMGGGGASPMDTMNLPPQAKQMLGGLMQMMGSKAGGAAPAPGAVATEGLRTDTTLKGPWDHAALLDGTQLMAVRNDVFVAIGLQSADYAKAKALMSAICSHL